MAAQTKEIKDDDCENLAAEREINESNGRKLYKHPDVDGGWAWVVAIGMATFDFTLGGFFRSFGVVFAAILEQYGQSASMTSLISALRAAFLIFLGPASTIISQRLTERVVIVTGAIIVSSGFIISYFARSLEFLIVSIGMLPGIGVSFIIGPANIMLGRYFDKRRARAITVTSSVGCIGQIVVPILMVHMIEAYSVQGALLVYGGIALNVIITGMVMKPIHLRENMADNESESNGTEGKKARNTIDCGVDRTSDKYTKDNPVINSNSNSVCDDHIREQVDATVGNCCEELTMVKFAIAEKEDDASLQATHQHTREFQLKRVDENCISDHEDQGITSVTIRKRKDSVASEAETEPLSQPVISNSVDIPLWKRICGPVFRFLRDMYPFELLLNVEYCLVICSNLLSLVLYTCQQNYLFAMTESLGFSKNQAAIFLSTFGLCDMIGRLTSGQLSDRKLIPLQYVMATSCFISGVAFSFVPIAHSIYAIVPLIILIGCFINVNLVLAMPLLVETIGLEDFPRGFSMLLACHGIFASIAPPLFGLVKDLTGRYNTMFPVAGGLQIVAGILLVIELFVRKRTNKRRGISS